MTKEEFLKLNEKDQRSLVNIALREKGWRIMPDDFPDECEYADCLLMINKGGDDWHDRKIETETPLTIVCGGMGWPYY
ncbi:hypothetical protein EB944_15005 [Salmonella enterica]|nr:hypothetical protein [Salmonella enterica]EIO3990309.1 hypothetical protein [Salmonella enterica]EKH9892379.1 hypothetical protein [Salmonella enterica]MDM78550.1 hypothetical protein [Salmonella enterica]